MTTSARSGRSNTWRFSTPVADFGPRDEPQRPQTHAVCSITQSGSATCRNVAPLWPFCPPLGRPDAPRRLPGTRGFAFNPSLEGGRELFELSCPNCRRRSATSASSAAIWRFSEAINSSTSTGRTMPPVDSNSPPAVSKDQPNKPLFKSPVTFPTHPAWELLPSSKIAPAGALGNRHNNIFVMYLTSNLTPASSPPRYRDR